MPIEPVYHSTREITGRLKAIDVEHPVIRHEQLEALAPNGDDVYPVRFQIEDAIKYTVSQLPERPTLADAKRALGSLVRNIDHGGRLHATLTHAMGIARPASDVRTLPAMPRTNYTSDIDMPVQSRREVAVVRHSHDAVERAIADFRQGVASEPYHFDDLSKSLSENARFLGHLHGRQDVYDTLDRAKFALGGLRENVALRDEQLHDQTSTEITTEQKSILDEVARGFVTDLVRSSQSLLQTSMQPSEREIALHQHVDSAMQEIDVSKEPLRFATSWVTDEHYPRAHSFIGNLPDFRNENLQYLENHGRLVDESLVKILRERAYPVESTHAEINDNIQRVQFARILRHPLVRAGMAAGTVFLHLNPHFYPIRALRPLIASRTYIAATLLAQANMDKIKQTVVRATARHLLQSHIEAPKLPEKALFDALRATEE